MKRLTVLLAVLLAMSSGYVAIGESPVAKLAPAMPRKARLITEYGLPGLDKKISLDIVEAMDVVDLIKFLAQKADLNVVIGREVTGTTKLMVKDVTLGDALEIVLAANNLAYEVKGNIIKVMSDKEYLALYGEGFYDRKQAKIIQLRYATPSKIAALLEQVKSSIGKIVYDDGTGSLVLIDTPDKIKEMEGVVQQAELPTVLRVMPTVTTNFALQYAKVEDLEPQITALLTKDGSIGQLRTDKRTKTLVVTDLPHVVQKIADVVRLFDRENKQVFIEAKIVQVNLTDSFKLGVNWDHVLEGLGPRFTLDTVSAFPLGLSSATPTAPASFGQLTYRTVVGGNDLNMVVEALSTMGDTKVLSSPHIATMDGQEATLKVIQNQPYAELTYEVGTTNITGKSYKFIEVGVTLAVTPRINENNFITMEIKPEISTIIGTYDAAGGQGVPIVKKSVAETTVSVKDGVTIIIAGMINETKDKQVSGIPLLRSIPVLGALFRWTTEDTANAETIVFLTPRIVTGAQPFLRSNDMKKRPRGSSPTAFRAGGNAAEETP